MQDVEHLFGTGTIPEAPKFDEEHKNWEYIVKVKDIGGTDLAVVFSIDEDDDIHLITGEDV